MGACTGLSHILGRTMTVTTAALVAVLAAISTLQGTAAQAAAAAGSGGAAVRHRSEFAHSFDWEGYRSAFKSDRTQASQAQQARHTALYP